MNSNLRHTVQMFWLKTGLFSQHPEERFSEMLSCTHQGVITKGDIFPVVAEQLHLLPSK